MRPFFSIITVTKNTEKKINLTIRSVLSQNFNNFEYIVIDGYSKDNTFANIKKYKDKRIKVFKYRDKSFYEGLNYGVQNSKGKYIAILNSGDIFYSNKILFLMKKKIIKFSKCHFFFSNLLYLDKKNKIKRVWKNLYYDNTLQDAFKIAHPTIFINAEVAQKFKYNENYKISSDLDFILRLLINKISFKYLNFFSVAMEQGGMSSSLNYLLIKLREDLIIHSKYFKLYLVHFLIKKISKLKDLFFINQKSISNKILKTIKSIS
jgi:glycosyltransferase involved in cell wall biosynthesis